MRTRSNRRLSPAKMRATSPAKSASPKRSPKCSKMVTRAMKTMKDRKGTPASKVAKVVAKTCNVKPAVVKRTIKKQVAKGRLIQTRSGGGDGLLLMICPPRKRPTKKKPVKKTSPRKYKLRSVQRKK